MLQKLIDKMLVLKEKLYGSGENKQNPNNQLPLFNLGQSVREQMDGKNITRLPANLALKASVGLALEMAKRLNAREEIISIITIIDILANSAINGFDEKDLIKHKDTAKKLLVEIRKIRKTRIVELSKKNEAALSKLEDTLVAATLHGAHGGLNSGGFSVSQIATGTTLGVLDGIFEELDAPLELKNAVKTAIVIFRLASDPTKLKAGDLKTLSNTFYNISQGISTISGQNILQLRKEKKLFNIMTRNVQISIEDDNNPSLAVKSKEIDISIADVTNNAAQTYSTIEKACRELGLIEISDHDFILKDHSTGQQVLSCKKPVQPNDKCIVKVKAPINSEIIRNMLTKMQSRGMTFKVNSCANIDAALDLIKIPGIIFKDNVYADLITKQQLLSYGKTSIESKKYEEFMHLYKSMHSEHQRHKF